MFRIGEFSQIARVSGRLLRYYDSIGLLSPARIDPETGYRYYSAAQLPRLNRILALKDLGLSLEQIAELIDQPVDAADIRGMLLLKKSELESSLREDAARLRHIDSRLAQIEEQGALADYDVVVKAASAQPFLNLRATFPGMDAAIATLRAVTQTVPRRVAGSRLGNLVVVAHSDFEEESLDLAIGFTLTDDGPGRPVALPDGRALAVDELPAVDTLATVVRSGPDYQSHLAFGALGVWMEANAFRIAGPCRELFLELPFQAPDQEETVVEIQFPVAEAA